MTSAVLVLLFATIIRGMPFDVKSNTSEAANRSAWKQCQKCSKPETFYVIGHAGGDWNEHCENSLESTFYALTTKDGGYDSDVNGIELDISLSMDGEIFLWHDPNPWSFTAVVRGMGYYIGKCKPVFKSSKLASELNFEQIRRLWYMESSNQERSNIVRLEDWLIKYASYPNLKMIWFDIKIEAVRINHFVEKLVPLLDKYSKSDLKIHFSGNEGGGELQDALMRRNRLDLSQRIAENTLSLDVYVTESGSMEYNAIKQISRSNSGKPLEVGRNSGVVCGCLANIGKPFLALNQRSGLNRIVRFNASLRNKHLDVTGSYIQMFVYTIDDPTKMEELLIAGVDGIITNRPKLLAKVRSKHNGRPE